MQNDTLELDQLQSAYKTAVEQWIDAIKQEEALASVNHTIAEVDQAHFREDEIRSKVKAAKSNTKTRSVKNSVASRRGAERSPSQSPGAGVAAARFISAEST
jgi:hypothetical protein